MILAAQLGVPEEQDPRALRRHRRLVRPEDRRCARGHRRRARRPSTLGRPVKWIEDRNEHLAVGATRARRRREIEAAVTADGVMLGVRMDDDAEHRRLPGDPFRRDRAARSSGCSRARQDRGARVQAHRRCSRNKATYVAYRGPWAAGDFLRERMIDIDRPRARRRAARRPAAQLRRPRRGAAADGHGPASPASRRGSRSSRPPTSRRLAGFRERQAEARADGRYLGHRHGARTSRRRRARRSRAAGRRDLGREVATRALDDDGTRHRHPADAARAEPRDDVRPDRGRRARRAVRAGAGRRRRHRHHARSGHRWQPGGDDGGRRDAPHGPRAPGEDPRRWPRTSSRRAPSDLEIADGVVGVKGVPVVQLPMASSHGSSPTATPARGADPSST